MKITVVAVGKMKEKFMKEALAEYAKRLSKFTAFEVVEVADEKAEESLSASQVEIVKQKEGGRILEKIKPGGYVIATAIEGQMLDSAALAALVEKRQVEGVSSIYFIIGGSLGLSAQVLGRADFLLSFSKMTFPHQLMRVILAEQVYRAFQINAGHPYHK